MKPQKKIQPTPKPKAVPKKPQKLNEKISPGTTLNHNLTVLSA